MIIIVTGTPGTGKTTVAKRVARELSARYIDVKKLIKQKRIYDSYDSKDRCYVVDTKKLNRELINEIKSSKKSLVIDSLLSHHLPCKYADLCIVTKCDIAVLRKRLEARRYSKAKVRDNLDSEIFDICLNEAKENGHDTFVIITTKGFKKDAVSFLMGEIHEIESAGRRAEQHD